MTQYYIMIPTANVCLLNLYFG